MIARLVAIAGPLNGLVFYIDDQLLSIGREWSNDIRLEDRFVSRHHCVIREELTQYIIEDLNSANGTYVDGKRVNATSLKEGSMIQAGASAFVFRLQYPRDTRPV